MNNNANVRAVELRSDDPARARMLLRRHPVAVSVAGAALVAAALILLWSLLPLGANADHAVGHLSLGVPVVLLLVLAAWTWPPPGPERAPRVARAVLLSGLAMWGGASIVEAAGAFGYDDERRANDLVVLHDIGVAIGPVGLALLLAGTIMSIGVAAAARRKAAGSRVVTVGVMLAAVAVLVFVVGAVIFGY